MTFDKLVMLVESSITYTLPGIGYDKNNRLDPKTLLYDFYVLSFLSSIDLEPSKQHASEYDKRGYHGGYSYRTDRIKHDLKYATETVVGTWKELLLWGLYGSILDEFYELYAVLREDISNKPSLLDLLNNKLIKQNIPLRQSKAFIIFLCIFWDSNRIVHSYVPENYWYKYGKETYGDRFDIVLNRVKQLVELKNQSKKYESESPIFPSRLRELTGERDDYREDRVGITDADLIADAVITVTGSNRSEFIGLIKYVFDNFEWGTTYGGPAWGNVCEAFLHLNNSKNIDDDIVAIDHIWDVQHNGGVCVNKLLILWAPELVYLPDKDDNVINYPLDWLNWVLNKKAHAPLKALLTECSSSVRKLAYQVLAVTNIDYLNRKTDTTNLPNENLQKQFEEWVKVRVAEDRRLSEVSLARQYAIFCVWQLHKRWPEVEPLILKDPEAAVLYAGEVLHERWPEAEPYIIKDPRSAFYYARNVIKGRWPEAEPYIQQSEFKADYIIQVLKRQFSKNDSGFKQGWLDILSGSDGYGGYYAGGDLDNFIKQKYQ